MDPQLIKRVIEAVLLAAGQPLSLNQLGALFTEHENVAQEDIARALEELALDCAERGIELKEVASGFRYQVREDVHGWVTRLWTERQTKYSRASLETLALIAYRQPITRAEIEQIRGVAVSSSIIKTLEEREWVRVVGYRDVPGRPALFGTSRAFLDYFNLKSLDELPPLAEVRDLDEFDPQLALAPVAADVPPDDTAANDAEAGEATADAATDADATAPVEAADIADAADDEAVDAAASPGDETVAEAAPLTTEPDDAAAETDAGSDDEETDVRPSTDAESATDDADLYDNEESNWSDGDADEGVVDRDETTGDDAGADIETPTDSHPNDTGDDAGEPDPTTSDDVPEHTA
jgi:segregation and condensation protein B